ncbi:hypothetical protein [Geodermatophilus sp. CPCC 206100]|uniref:hypothetical protein n=1 Tax=Geodermatophilus sp. CPCC 206100 TaxID=3020054 RepID=UPI003B00D804
MTTHYEVTVAGRVPEWTAGSIRARFGPVEVHSEGGTTAVSGTVCDQSALRALLELMWDTGVSVVALSVDGSPRSSRPTGSDPDEEAGS